MIAKALRRYVTGATIGLAALVFAPPSAATQMAFSFAASDTVTVPTGQFDVSGMFSDSASQSTSFAQFNDLGGMLVLNSVTISVTTTAATQLSASVTSECEFSSCAASATNDSTFSVGVDAPTGGVVEFALSPANLIASVTAMTDCNVSTQDCETVADSNSLNPMLSMFTLTLNTPAQLAAFIGNGSISVIPEIALAGAYQASTDNSTLSASTTWAGVIDVTYAFTPLTPGVPEPATLLLFGAAVAALAFYQTRRSRHQR